MSKRSAVRPPKKEVPSPAAAAKFKPAYQFKPRSISQNKYLKTITSHAITFGVGPAGTGKTFCGCAMAVQALKNKEIERIILVRPIVESGERLGFLPGTMQDKVDPYLRPLYDALNVMLTSSVVEKMLETGVIEIAPLAFMRGRTFEDAFVLMDEAQNTTKSQMKMLLTRLGERSRMVITGDLTQIDLPRPEQSGLFEAVRILKDRDGIGFAEFSEKDVVRHSIVQMIVNAYEEDKNASKEELSADL